MDHASPRARRTRGSAYSPCTLPVAARDVTATVRDSTAAATRRRHATHYRLGGPVALRLACRYSEQAKREREERERKGKKRSPRPVIRCRSAPRVLIHEKRRDQAPREADSYSTRLMHRNFTLDSALVAWIPIELSLRRGFREDPVTVCLKHTHESRILTPGGSAISPGGAGPPASPSPGHYHPPAHSPPLVKVSPLFSSGISKNKHRFVNETGPNPIIRHVPDFLSPSLSALLPESSAISEFDATSAIRYRPRKSDCSLWSRNNCVGLPPSGEAGMAGNGFANHEEKEADDDDGCKGGCPSSFSSAAAVNPSGDSARQLSTDCRWRSPGRNLTWNDSWSVPCSVEPRVYDIISELIKK
ncbi:Uncharacterized protein DBV15_01137 [Temnothorax longispinosus]|uniref:Uncharacterized protein n=1 Tax=Temnothorax longispinosus TaxID=300112 RepID=A0A4S2J9C9_9HYME|nr:Uncharacterized protein DBV15_01137 [Temnothorax longispinosus]